MRITLTTLLLCTLNSWQDIVNDCGFNITIWCALIRIKSLSALIVSLVDYRGFESVIEDYVPQALKKVSHGLLYLVSIATFGGLMYLNVFDVGICKAVKMIWSL